MAVDGKDIEEQVKDRVEAEEGAYEVDDNDKGKDDDPITPEFIKQCFKNNERGDGMLFAREYKGTYINDKTSGRWFKWGGHHWDFDELESVHADVDGIARRYEAEAKNLLEKAKEAEKKKRDKEVLTLQSGANSYKARAHRLRSVRGETNCLTMSHRVEDGLGVRSVNLDRRPMLLACANGVVELETGKFRDGRPDDYLVKAIPHDYLGYDHPAPEWEEFLNAVYSGDDELTAYTRRLFGYGITGLTTEHVFPLLYGAGRNGKGTLVETLYYVLGTLAGAVQSEMLLDQKNARSSSGPTPDIMALKGLRLAFASETDEGKKFSTSKAKWLTGGDTLTGRAPHDKYETRFSPSHLLFLQTNHLPHAPADDFGFWQRVHLLPFDIRFVDDPKKDNERPLDKHLPARLRAEASGILAWLIRGCIEWQRYGLTPPKKVLAATRQYQHDEDTVKQFLEACCSPLDDTTDEDYETYGDLHKAYLKWYQEEGGRFPLGKTKFGKQLDPHLKRVEKGGVIKFYGARLKSQPASTDYDL